MQFVIVPIFFLIALGGMLLALKFSKYKQDDRGCCGGGHCSTAGNSHLHSTCHSRALKIIDEKQSGNSISTVAGEIKKI